MKVLCSSRYSAIVMRCSLFLLLLFLVAFSLLDPWLVNDYVDTSHTIPTNDKSTSNVDALKLVALSTQRVWDEREYLVIFGFPSLDIPVRRWRRQLQRVTCWQFPEVAARHNNFAGAFLPLYLLARHPKHNFVLSRQLLQEADQWQDVVIHPLNEGSPSTRKIISDNGYWGIEAEVGSSQKTFFWFQFALRQFPRASYVGKGDDDSFISVPQYLTDLRRLPINKIYWGAFRNLSIEINRKGDKGNIRYMFGYCVTLSRDTADSFVSHKPFHKLMTLPYRKELEPEFKAMNMQFEDVMVGRLLQEVKFPAIYVKEGFFRLWLRYFVPPNDRIVAYHKPNDYEYYTFMCRMMNYTKPRNVTRIIKYRSDLYYMEDPKKVP